MLEELAELFGFGIYAADAVKNLIKGKKNSGTEENRTNTADMFTGEQTGEVVYLATNPHNQSDNMFKFNYKKTENGWKAYIIRMPSLRGRDASLAVTHRLRDSNGHYVCWDRELKKLSDVQNVSRVWADHILEYIRTGETFG